MLRSLKKKLKKNNDSVFQSNVRFVIFALSFNFCVDKYNVYTAHSQVPENVYSQDNNSTLAGSLVPN